DIIACATKQWRCLTPETRDQLQHHCQPYFLQTLELCKPGVMLLINGRRTWRAMEVLGLQQVDAGTWTHAGSSKKLDWSKGTVVLPSGKALRYLAWNLYLQRGMPKKLRLALGTLISK